VLYATLALSQEPLYIWFSPPRMLSLHSTIFFI
jgi:hypothetical protein